MIVITPYLTPDLTTYPSLPILAERGAPEDPIVPLNLIGDFGGGGMLLAVGVLIAIIEARQSGQGQVVDAAMVDGAVTLNAMMLGFLATGRWTDQRANNRLNEAVPYYPVYRCVDGHVVVVCVEPKFWQDFLEGTGFASVELFSGQENRDRWPRMKARISEVMKARTQATWEQVFPASKACVSPVLSMSEAAHASHNVARGTFAPMGNGFVWPSPAPRFSRAKPDAPTSAPRSRRAHGTGPLRGRSIGSQMTNERYSNHRLLSYNSVRAASDSHRVAARVGFQGGV